MDARTESTRSRWIRAGLAALGVSAAYYVGAHVGFALTPAPQPVSTLWPPNAILIGALLLVPVRWWPGVLLAALPAHLAVELGNGVPLPMVLCWFVSNVTEALLGAAGVRWFIRRPVRFDTFHRVGVFVLFAALLAPFVSSFLDAAFVRWNAWGSVGFWDLWRVRFFSNVLANLTLVPAIVALMDIDVAALRSVAPRRLLEGVVLVGILLLVCAAVFTAWLPGVHDSPALLYTPLPLLLWAVVRFGPEGASASLLILSLISIWETVHGDGPFVQRSIEERVLSLQIFLIVTYIPLMALAAAIRERVTAEREARLSERYLKLALGAAQMRAWEWHAGRDGGRWSERVPQFPRHDGAGNGALDRNAVLATVLADDRPVVDAAIDRAISEDVAYEVQFRTVRPDGDVRWTISKGAVERDGAGRPVRMLGIDTDITDLKAAAIALRSEATLRESEARLRGLADATPQIVFTARANGVIDYFNRKWYELTGGPHAENGDPEWLEALHPSDRDACVVSWREDVAAGRPHEHEGRFWSARTATYRWHLVRALPMRDASGTVYRWYGTATDIDDRRRVEQALRESEMRLQTLRSELETRVTRRTLELLHANRALKDEIDVRRQVEVALRASEERFAKAFRASLDAIAIASQPSMRILEVNDRWQAMFGYPGNEAIGHTVDELHVYASERERERISETVRTIGYVSEQELDMRHKDGTPLRVLLAAETVEVAGEPCVIIMIRDITERQRAEHEIAVQRSELAHLGRVALLGELSGALAHELNQPLAAILANARAAHRMLARGDADLSELGAILEDIVADDRRAGEVIQRVRALIRKQETEPQAIVPNELVSDVLALAHSDLIQRSVSVTSLLSPNVSPVQGDRIQLQQVLLNLIVNACDAMADNPPHDRTMTVKTMAAGDAIRISVSDSGTGIAVEPIDNVFEPFVTSKAHGLGLGLAICRSIVEAHGGRMWAANNDASGGTGATINVLLPAAPGASAAPVSGANATYPAGRDPVGSSGAPGAA